MQNDYYGHVMLPKKSRKVLASSPTDSLIRERNITVPKSKHKGGERGQSFRSRFGWRGWSGDIPLKMESNYDVGENIGDLS